jgi:hypothetical protein
MQPGVEHIVFTLDNSIVVGSHFFSEVTLLKSMSSGLREHFWGRYGTNTSHLGSEVILCRILAYYHEKLLRGSLGGERWFNYLYLSFSSPHYTDAAPPPNDMAALLIMMLVPELFEPQPAKNERGEVEPWDWPETTYSDRHHAKFHAKSLLQSMPELIGIVHANMSHLMTPQCRQELLRNSQYQFRTAVTAPL